MSTTYSMQALLEKSRAGDPDFRWMALSDVNQKLGEATFSIDDSTEGQLVDQVLTMFSDINSEVKSMAAKTISMLVGKVKEDRVQTIIDKLTVMTSGKDDVRDIASLALKTVVQEISPDSKLANTACTKLAPKILVQLKNTASSQDVLIQLIEVLGDIYARFDSTIRAQPNAQSEGIAGLTPLLNDSRGAVRKRAIRAIGNLVACSGETVFTNLVEKDIKPSLSSGSEEQLKTSIALCGTLALSAPKRTGKKLQDLLPSVLKAVEKDDEELKEVALQTLETFLLRCPTEMSPSISATVETANKYLKYDPNYAGDDDMEEDAAGDMNGDGEDEDEEEDYADDYDDDDDVSWKVRRASVKVLNMALETRLEFLSLFYKSIAPQLIARFGEREETVKLEIWSTYTNLLKQTAIWAGNTGIPNGTSSVPTSAVSRAASEDGMNGGSRASSPVSSLKRKRDVQMEVDDSPLTSLRGQAPQVTKTIIKQLSTSKSIAVRQAGFTLLQQLVLVLQGGLDSSFSTLVPVVQTVLKSSDSGSVTTHAAGSSTNLKIQALDFLALVFKTHHLRSIQSSLPKLVPLITSSLTDKSPKVAAQAFVAASELVKLVKPISANGPGSPSVMGGSGAQIKTIFDATLTSLSRSDADQEVREKGIICLGDLVVHCGADFGADLQKALAILKERLRNENTRLIALQTIAKIADAPSAHKNVLYGSFLQDVAGEVVTFLRRNNKPVQAASFATLETILKKSGDSLPADTCEAIVSNLQPSIANPDIHLARSLNALSTVLDIHKDSVSTVESEILPSVYELIASPSASSGVTLEALRRFFAAYVTAGGEASDTVIAINDLAAGSKGGLQVSVNASKCIGAIFGVAAEKDQAAAKKIAKDTAARVKSSKTQANSLCLALLIVGEIGRNTDLNEHQDIFKLALGNLTNASEDVRSSAAFAIGNMAAGSPSTFLPPILAEIEKASKDDRKLHLLLGSIKETISHSSSSTLSELSNALWAPLFQICETASAQQQAGAASSTTPSSTKAGDGARLDGTRNIAAECLGKITLTNPSMYLGQLQSKLQSESAGTRAAVITAIRFTFTDESSSYDDLLAPLIVQFLSLMHDSDLTVRRLAVSSLTSAAHNKPQLIRDHFAQLQPLLYSATKIDPSLIHEVVMGPFKVKVDDGLNIRKAAYQCMYTLLETCLNKLDLSAYLDIIVAGLSDDDDIKVSCYLMLVKLSTIAPTAVAQRLDAAAKPFDGVLKTKLKETTVKQEVEKLAEMQRSALRTMASLLPLASDASTPKFMALCNETRNSVLWGVDFKEMIRSAADNKSSTNNADRMEID